MIISVCDVGEIMKRVWAILILCLVVGGATAGEMYSQDYIDGYKDATELYRSMGFFEGMICDRLGFIEKFEGVIPHQWVVSVNELIDSYNAEAVIVNEGVRGVLGDQAEDELHYIFEPFSHYN